MELSGYVDELQRQLAVAADAGGDDARDLAQRLTAPLDASVRLILLEALAAAAAEITAELAPGSVDVRLRGRDPEFIVAVPAAATFESASDRSAPARELPPVTAAADDASTSRTTLRIPDQLKVQVEQAAARDGVSVNTWLVRAIAAAVEPTPSRRPTETHPADGDANRVTGWVR
ncbi:MAG TPA: histidine kinase [Agromyces sp.]|nr:histidine kinase [Agromyces sp.]